MEIEQTCPIGGKCEDITRKYRLFGIPFGPKVKKICRFYSRLRGHDSNSGKPVDRDDCTFAFQPILLTEIARTQIQATQEREITREALKKELEEMRGVVRTAARQFGEKQTAVLEDFSAKMETSLYRLALEAKKPAALNQESIDYSRCEIPFPTDQI